MVKAIAKTLAAVLAAAAGAVLALNGAGVIAAPVELLIGCVVTSAALAALATIGSAWAEWRQRRLGARRDLVELELTATVWAIVDQVGGAVDYRDLGLAVYGVRRRWWPFGSQLQRRYRVQASRRPTASHVRWRPGKGVIGACVSKGEVVAVDLARMYAALGRSTADEWTAVPEDVRLGLDYAEYLDVRDKYAVVIASPLIDDSGPRATVVGCLALDGPAGSYATLTTAEVLGLLNSRAQALPYRVE